ncbi:cold-shock protein [Nocardia farcinica]|uniref:cold-shock protein n=1 Tax=Nocardia farcinica TaxID=37329 RepID=UPI003CC7EA85
MSPISPAAPTRRAHVPQRPARPARVADTPHRAGPRATAPEQQGRHRDSGPWRHGTVAWFDAEKGFGFITPDDRSPAVFVEFHAIEAVGYRTLVAGGPVVYRAEETKAGPEAVAVRPYRRGCC